MKKTALIISLSTLMCLNPKPAQAAGHIKLAQSLFLSGALTVALGEAAHYAYKKGYYKSAWNFLWSRPWWAVGLGAAGTGVALLGKDAAGEIFSPAITFAKSFAKK